jgi:transcriptional accessory protein Tex/SPT6
MYIEDQIKIIATGLGIKPKQVTSVLLLLEQGATIPFVARYRKELTEELNEEEITAIRDGYEKLTEITKRRESIINTLKETGQLTDDLELQLNNAVTLSELQDNLNCANRSRVAPPCFVRSFFQQFFLFHLNNDPRANLY